MEIVVDYNSLEMRQFGTKFKTSLYIIIKNFFGIVSNILFNVCNGSLEYLIFSNRFFKIILEKHSLLSCNVSNASTY